MPPAEKDDWWKVCNILMQEFHYRPWEIGNLTYTEIIVMLMNRDEANKGSGNFNKVLEEWQNHPARRNDPKAMFENAMRDYGPKH